MTEAEARYMKKLESLLDGVGKLEEKEVARSLGLLKELRKEVALQIVDSEWKTHYVPQLKDAVEKAASRFQRQYQARVSDAEVNLWKAGIDQVDWPLSYVGIQAGATEISRTALEIVQGYSADLITNLSRDAAAKINAEISMGILGGKTPWEVMQAIGRNLDDPSVFKTIAVRAETITRTELARVNSLAREARIRGVVEANPKMVWLKKWISSKKAHSRPHHALLNGTTVGVERNFPGGIPYPHAPGLPAKEVINCGCSHVLTLADWEQAEGELHGKTPYQPRAIWD
jgi:hypothetical protein